MPPVWQQTADESIIAFASVRNEAATSEPSFGDWLDKAEQKNRGKVYTEDIVPTLVEVTRGSPNKYEVDKETGQLMLDRVLHSAVYYPGDYGYVPQTLCGDGDPLDILIVTTMDAGSVQGLDCGSIANVRVVGMMDMEDESGHDEKVIGVLANQKCMDHITQLHQVPEHLRFEIQHFFENYKLLEVKKGKPKWAKVLGWADKARALQVVAESRARYAELHIGGKTKYHPFVRVPKCPTMLHVKQHFGDGGQVGDVTCYVNVTKGCMNSYIYRQDTTYRHYKYSLDMPYPGDYGIVCQTWSPTTRKPLEILILSTYALEAGCLADCRIVGGLERSYRSPNTENITKDFKLFAVLPSDPRANHILSLTQLSPHLVEHLCNFFLHSVSVADCSDGKILRTFHADEAAAIYKTCHEEYNKAFKDQDIHNKPNLWCLPWDAAATKGSPEERIYPAVVEASKHSFNKYRFDRDAGLMKCEGPLNTSTFWPGNCGFIPQTVAEDGKPVDVVILSTVPLRSGSVAEIRVVGAAECIDEMGPDMKMIGVPKSEPRMKEWKDIGNVPAHFLDEMVHFFNAYQDLGPAWKFCRFERWIDAGEAMKYIQGAHSRFFLFMIPMQRMEKRLTDIEEDRKRSLALLEGRLRDCERENSELKKLRAHGRL
mmetsp:Transcript_121074/g.342570  ORF Transcript_121074/g.342570 Transcript_121074/m.342570 type:complete len:654 (-) Transcript_121074:207-2168(-)